MRQVYLDYNATTPVAASVFEAMKPFFTEHFGNPSSSHALGAACHQAVEDAREQVASLLNASPEEIFFTGGGTESNNLAIKGVCQTESGFEGHIISSSIEHPATKEPIRYLEQMGCEATIVGTDEFGVVDPRSVARALRDDTKLVTLMHANNEIGAIQPISEIAEVCRQNDIRFHTDAAQAVGKIPTDVDELGVDLLSIAGHKLYAPKGIGALYVRTGTRIEPVLHGAGHEQGLRPGTENVAYIVGLGAAAKMAQLSLDQNYARLSELRDRLFDGLRQEIGASLTFNGPIENRLPNTLSANFPNVSGAELLQQANEILASTGAACHSGDTKLSDTLSSIGISPEIARGTVRLSLGWHTSEEEVDFAIKALSAAWHSISSD